MQNQHTTGGAPAPDSGSSHGRAQQRATVDYIQLPHVGEAHIREVLARVHRILFEPPTATHEAGRDGDATATHAPS